MPKLQSRWSTDDLLVPVNLVVTDGANTNYTADPVYFQLVWGGLPLRSQPTADGWVQGFWLNNGYQGVLAGILVGPAGGALNPGQGRWAVGVKIGDDPTAPVDFPDVLTIN